MIERIGVKGCLELYEVIRSIAEDEENFCMIYIDKELFYGEFIEFKCSVESIFRIQQDGHEFLVDMGVNREDSNRVFLWELAGPQETPIYNLHNPRLYEYISANCNSKTYFIYKQ